MPPDPRPPSAARQLDLTVRGLTGTLLVLAAVAVCVRLGFWQLDRRVQRLERNHALATRLHEPPVALGSSVRDTSGLRFRRARAEGRWDGARSIILPGRSLRGVPGVHVLTPLVFEDGPAAVLVNRGWVPSADGATIDEALLDAGPDAGGVEGMLLGFPGRDASLAQRPTEQARRVNGGFRRVWFAIDEAALRGQFPYRLLDVELRVLPHADAPPFPVPLPAPELDEGPHLGYAIQWFAFAGIFAIGWLALVLRSRREPRAD